MENLIFCAMFISNPTKLWINECITCLNYFIPLSSKHLHFKLKEISCYYHSPAGLFALSCFVSCTPESIKRLEFVFTTINSFVSNATCFYPLKTSENLTVFWCFQGVEKECIGNRGVNEINGKNDEEPQIFVFRANEVLHTIQKYIGSSWKQIFFHQITTSSSFSEKENSKES